MNDNWQEGDYSVDLLLRISANRNASNFRFNDEMMVGVEK